MQLLVLLPYAIALLAAVGAPVSATTPDAPEPPWKGAEILEDEQWRRAFLGTYGVLSGQEPPIRDLEREVLTEVLALMERDPKSAVARLVPLVGPTSSAALDFVLGNLQFQNGDEEAAKKTYRLALSKFPDFRRAHKNLALLLIQDGELAPAAQHLTRAVELGERDGRNFGLLGYAYLSLENNLAAEEAYRNAILQEPESKDWQLGLARTLLAREEYEEAVALFETLLERDPGDYNLWLLQANAYLGEERPLEAAANLEAVRLLGKAQPSALVLLGDIYMNEGTFDLAKDVYLEAIRADEGGERFDTAFRAADLLVRTGSWPEATEVLGQIDRQYAEARTPDEELELLTLRARIAQATGRDAEAAEMLETIVQRDGTRGDALLALADHHRAQGETERAVFLLERAEKLEDFEYPALLKHASIEVGRRDYAAAASLLRRAIEIKREPRVERFLARVEDAIAR